MNPAEIYELIKKESPAALGNVQEQRAVAIIRAAFRLVAGQLASAEEGTLNVGGLGRFVVKKGEKEKDGVTVQTRHVAYRAGIASTGEGKNAKAGTVKKHKLEIGGQAKAEPQAE